MRSSVPTTSAMFPRAWTYSAWTSGKSIAQFAHFFSHEKRIGHQKDSTLRSISVPSDQTPVIQSQYKHQMRSWPIRPLNFWRETLIHSAPLYGGKLTSLTSGG